jgi:hypothetical protein
MAIRKLAPLQMAGFAWTLLAISLSGSQSLAAEASITTNSQIVGMYVHQHWPYRHPYAARTWTLEDWQGYADGLKRIGYNTIMIWPVLETMPEPLTPSDQASLDKIAKVIDLLHRGYGMKVWLALCPNVSADDAAAAAAPFEQRHYFYCDTRVNPGDPAALRRMMERREKLLRPLAQVDAIAIIDSDPGGYPGSTNAEFVHLLVEHRRLFDRLRPGIELVYWMHVGWQGYCRFYQSGRFSWGTEQENIDVLNRLKELNPEPWGIANGLVCARKAGVESRVISFSYGRIEGEPSFPITNFGGDNAYKGGQDATARGRMGNAQTHCVQLPNTFAFAQGARGRPLAREHYVRFADDLITGQGELIVRAWQALSGGNPAEMLAAVAELRKLTNGQLTPGPLRGLLFGSARRFIDDLEMQLRLKAAFETFRTAVAQKDHLKEPLRAFVTAAEVWQRQHGYENAWWWPEPQPTLRKLDSAPVNAVLDTQFTIESAPPKGWAGTGYEFTHRVLRETESYTPRLLAAIKQALAEMP